MVYALLRVPVRSGVPAVLSSCRLCFMRPARLLACTRPRSATFFIVVHCPLSRFTLSVRLPLDTQEHITFSAVCQAKLLLFPFRVETKQRRSLDVSDYSTFGAVCQELFFVRPCYAVPGVYVQSMPFGVPLSRRRFIDCLHDTIRRAICQQVFFAFLAPFGFRIRCSPLFRTFQSRFLCLISVFSALSEL